MSVLIDSGVLFAAAVPQDSHHRAAARVLRDVERATTTTAVLTETWRLLRARTGERGADQLVAQVLRSDAAVEAVGPGDVHRALEIGDEYPDQPFSLVDRISFAVMHRLGITRVATFDHHFAIYRFGPQRRRAFEILR